MNEYTFKINTKIKSCYSDAYSMNGYCPFHFHDLRSGNHCSLSDDVTCLKTKRPKNCPLKEVPTHGDLIDKIKLREHAYVIQMRDRISFHDALVLALKDAPIIIEASKEKEK